MSAGLPSRISDDILGEMWAKFCGFCCNAAVSTLTRALAGEIATSSAGAGFVAATFDACARVCAAEGYPIANAIKDMCLGLYSQPGLGYRPSIAADFEAGRPTEGEHTIGDLVRRADQRGLDVPILRAALCNLQIQEARSRGSARG
jgi:2-dehydropantoate 2-reductase